MNPLKLNKCTLIAAFVRIGLALAGLTLVDPAGAVEADRELELTIQAGYWIEDMKKGVIVYSKGFELVQGSLHIVAETATIYRGDDSDSLDRIVLEGQPVCWRETLDNGSLVVGRANHIEYDLHTDDLVLRQNAVIYKNDDKISGDLIHYNLKTQFLKAGGEGETSGRVTMTIRPKNKGTTQDNPVHTCESPQSFDES